MINPINGSGRFYSVKQKEAAGADALTDGSRDGAMKDLFPQQVARDQEKLRTFMADVRENGTAVHLTEEQVRRLSERFKPNDMSARDYHNFVYQLCEWGVLDHENTQYISIGPQVDGLIPLDFAEPLGVITTVGTDRHFGWDFASSGGNVLDWARYMSTFESFNPDTGAFEKTRSAILFGKIRDVLEMISGIGGAGQTATARNVLAPRKTFSFASQQYGGYPDGIMETVEDCVSRFVKGVMDDSLDQLLCGEKNKEV